MKIQELYEKASDEVKEKVDELLKPIQFVKGWNYIELDENQKWLALNPKLMGDVVERTCSIDLDSLDFNGDHDVILCYERSLISSRPATEEEVKTALIKVAERKGYKPGVTIKPIGGFYYGAASLTLSGKIELDISGEECALCYKAENGFYTAIYFINQWAEIVKEEPTPEDLKHRDEHYKSQSPEVLNKRIEELERDVNYWKESAAEWRDLYYEELKKSLNKPQP